MFWDLIGNPGFEVPQGSGLHVLSAGAPWIGAIDESGQLRMAAQTYRQSGEDYAAGPVADAYPPTYDQRYQRTWVVTAAEIDTHQVQYNQPGYVAPPDLLDWPGNGDTTNGEAWQLAPFVDLDQDGVYDPTDGEYPEIKGDQALFAMFNDERVLHTESGGLPLGVEVHLLAWAIDASDTSTQAWLGETLFLDYRVHSRRRNLSEAYFGLWLDWDVGFFGDDYTGCDTAREAWYGYNGDSLDEGPRGYGSAPPAIGATWLNQPMTHHMYYNNDFSVTGNPFDTTLHYYGYLTGRWKDGLPLTFGGNGYATGKPTPYAYPSLPTDSSAGAWHEVAANSSPGDRRSLSSVGRFRLPIGSTFCARLALVHGRAVGMDHLGSVLAMLDRVDSVRTYFADSLGQGCLAPTMPVDTSHDDTMNTALAPADAPPRWQLAPNPAHQSLQLISAKAWASPGQYTLLDTHGRVLHRGTLPTQGRLRLDISHVPAGLYLMRIQDRQGVQTLRWRKE